MRSTAAMLAVLAVAVTGPVVLQSSSASATHNCVDRHEFRNTRVNTTLLRLEERYETHGRLESQGGGYKTKSYPACYGGDDARVWIVYRHHHDAWRVDSKWYTNP